MRFIIAYYLLLIYVSVVIKPLIPFVLDAWDHEFNEIEHISLVHAKFGSNHLEKELAATDNNNDKSKNQNSLRSEDQVPFHILSQEGRYGLMVKKQLKRYFVYKHNSLPFVWILIQGQPPEFS